MQEKTPFGLRAKCLSRSRVPPERKIGTVPSLSMGKAQAGCSGFVLGVRRRTGADPSKDTAIRDREFEHLPPLFLFRGIIVFLVVILDNGGRKNKCDKEVEHK